MISYIVFQLQHHQKVTTLVLIHLDRHHLLQTASIADRTSYLMTIPRPVTMLVLTAIASEVTLADNQTLKSYSENVQKLVM